MPAHKLTDTDISGRKLRVAITQQGLTQEKIAKRMGVNQTTVSYWIRDINRISVGNLKRLCRILNISPADVLEEVKQ